MIKQYLHLHTKWFLRYAVLVLTYRWLEIQLNFFHYYNLYYTQTQGTNQTHSPRNRKQDHDKLRQRTSHILYCYYHDNLLIKNTLTVCAILFKANDEIKFTRQVTFWLQNNSYIYKWYFNLGVYESNYFNSLKTTFVSVWHHRIHGWNFYEPIHLEMSNAVFAVYLLPTAKIRGHIIYVPTSFNGQQRRSTYACYSIFIKIGKYINT